MNDEHLLPLQLFDALPGICVLLKADPPRYTIVAVTEGVLQVQTSPISKQDLIGKSFFEPWPDNPGDSMGNGSNNLRTSFDYAIAHKAASHLPVQRYDLPNSDGSFTEKYWATTNNPVLAANGEVTHIIHTSTDITDRIKVKLQGEKLKGLEQAYSLFMQLPLSIHMIKGHELMIGMANGPTLEYWGRGTEVIGKPLMEALPELEGQGYDVFLREVLDTGEEKEFYEAPIVLQRHDRKETGYFNFIYKPYYEEGSEKPAGVVVVSAEVTDKVLAKKEMAEQKQRLELAVEIAALGDFRIDIASQTGTYSQQLMDWFQLDGPQASLDTISSRVHPDDRSFVLDTLERSIRGRDEGRHDIIYRLPQKNGRLLYLRSIGQVHWTEGQPVSIYGIIQDITEQVTARERLEKSEAHLELLSNTVPAMIFYLDAEQRYRSYNERFMEWFDVDATEVIGKTVREFLGEETYKTTGPHLSVAYTGQQEQYEMFVPMRMGDVRWLNIVYTPHKDEAGKVLGLIVHATDVTQRKRTETSLRESETRFRSLIEEAPVATCLFIGKEMMIELANDTMLGYWGKDKSVIGRPFAAALPELEGQPFPGILDDVFATGKTYEAHGASAHLEVNGSLGQYYFDFTFKPLFDTEGKVYGIINMAIDVTSQVLSTQRIEESRRELLASFNDSPVGIAVIAGADLTFKMVNPFYALLSGRPPEALVDKPLLEAMPELAGQGFDTLLREVMTTGTPFAAKETPVEIRRGGEAEIIYIDHTYQPQLDENGKVTGVLVVVIEVTQQVLTRRGTEEKEAALRNAVELAELGTWTMDMTTGICVLSKRHVEMFGLDSQVSTAEEGIALIAEADRDRVSKAFYRALEPGSDGRYESEYGVVNARTGEPIIIRALGQVYYDKDGKAVKIAGTAQDVTVQRRTQAALEAEVQKRTKELAEAIESLNISNKELKRSNQNLEEFAHAASHDLKEPIRKIHFFTHQLKEQLSTRVTEGEVKSFNRIENATQRMGNLIDDLLLYSHVSQRPQDMETIDLNEKIKRVLEDLELDVQEKGAVVRVGQLPSVQGYTRQLQQLFQNLISNALKYARKDVPPQIDITASTSDEGGKTYHVLSVKDNGIGFEHQYADKIFQMFTRLHGKAEYSGTGVGLSIVKKVVENHNGMIRVESELEQGSTFSVYLPAGY